MRNKENKLLDILNLDSETDTEQAAPEPTNDNGLAEIDETTESHFDLYLTTKHLWNDWNPIFTRVH